MRGVQGTQAPLVQGTLMRAPGDTEGRRGLVGCVPLAAAECDVAHTDMPHTDMQHTFVFSWGPPLWTWLNCNDLKDTGDSSGCK
jgi:hypothetical protein